MVDGNDALAVQIVGEHVPVITIDSGYCECCGPDYQMTCAAPLCKFESSLYNDTVDEWPRHVQEAINDHLGPWGPEECEHGSPIDEYCGACMAIYEDSAAEHEW